MSEKIDTGGYAFPFSPTGSDSEQNGLTLLDYFAAKAMNGLLSRECYKTNGDTITAKPVAKDAYILAEAMLAEKRRIEGGL